MIYHGIVTKHLGSITVGYQRLNDGRDATVFAYQSETKNDGVQTLYRIDTHDGWFDMHFYTECPRLDVRQDPDGTITNVSDGEAIIDDWRKMITAITAVDNQPL